MLLQGRAGRITNIENQKFRIIIRLWANMGYNEAQDQFAVKSAKEIIKVDSGESVQDVSDFSVKWRKSSCCRR
jgi:hypothetical protein